MDVREKLSAAAEANESPERFLRGQRRGSRSRRLRLGRGLVRWTVAVAFTLGLVALGVWGAGAMSRAPELTVDRVRVEGNERLSDSEIIELLELSEGSNILTLDLDQVREKLLRSAWIRDVSLERVLPATLTLSIEEREPVAVAVLGELYLLAGDGTVLDLVSPYADIGELPVARGLLVAGSAAPERLELAGRVASAITAEPRLGRLVSEIDVGEGASSIAVRLRTPSLTMLVTESGGIERLQQTVPLIDGVVARFPLLEVVDLRFQGRIYLRMAEASRALGSHETSLLKLERHPLLNRAAEPEASTQEERKVAKAPRRKGTMTHATRLRTITRSAPYLLAPSRRCAFAFLLNQFCGAVSTPELFFSSGGASF